MHPTRSVIVAFTILACSIASLTACSGGSDDASAGTGSMGGVAGIYTSVDQVELFVELTSGGAVKMPGGSDAISKGTYTIDGERIIVSIAGQKHTFVRDGDCIEEGRNIFGKLCKGGKAGQASNVSTRTPPATSGTWVAKNADGTITIDFKPGDKFTLSMVPVAGSQMGDAPFAKEGTFVTEDDTLYTQLDGSTSMVLKWVNGTYESTVFGLPAKFAKK
jgi:hypothetical protein